MSAVAGLLLAALMSGCAADAPAADLGASASHDVAATSSTGGTGAAPADGAGNSTGGNASLPIVELKVALSGVYPALIAFDPGALEAPAGSRMRVTFENTDLNPLGKHNWKIKGTDFGTKVIGVGETETIEFDAPSAGTYDYVCSVPQHEGFGMKGTLTVREA